MATELDARIHQTLVNHLKGATFTPAQEIIHSNRQKKQPAEGFLEVQAFRNDPDSYVWGSGANRHMGLFQVTVHIPKDTGEVDGLEIAGQVKTRFARGTIIDDEAVVKVYRDPTVASGLPGDKFFEIPVVIPWESTG